VKLAAPELTADQLVGVRELAEIGGIAASTLRAYIARGEADVPPAQATIGGRSVWSRPVAEEWAEQRRREPAAVAEAVSVERSGATMPPGIAELCDRYERVFLSALWDNPSRRRRWALRWRNQAAVRELARDLAWYVAADVQEGRIISTQDLAVTVRHAVLDDLNEQLGGTKGDPDDRMYGITPPTGRMLGWLVRHRPSAGQHAIGEIIGTAERRYHIPRKTMEFTLRTSLRLDSKLDDQARKDFLERVLSPANYHDDAGSRAGE
jgi:predicted DNA-binding transcriptional regulator AlpA